MVHYQYIINRSAANKLTLVINYSYSKESVIKIIGNTKSYPIAFSMFSHFTSLKQMKKAIQRRRSPFRAALWCWRTCRTACPEICCSCWWRASRVWTRPATVWSSSGRAAAPWSPLTNLQVGNKKIQIHLLLDQWV